MKTAKKSSKVWLFALPAGGLLVAFGLWSFTQGPGPERGATSDSKLAKVGIQLSDLPQGFVRCSFSGDINTYLGNARRANMDTYREVDGTWGKLKATGATEAYVAFYGNNKEACDTVLDNDTRQRVMEHSMSDAESHPTVVFSIVVSFRDEGSAVSAYKGNVFGQLGMKPSPGYQVLEGVSSGLGVNSVVGMTTERPVPVHDAVWQKGTIEVRFGSENLPVEKARQVTAAVDARIP